jgi:hypothetical protein
VIAPSLFFGNSLRWTVATSQIRYPVSVRGVSVACPFEMARTVTVKLLKIDGSPIAGAVLPFEQMSGSYTPQTQQPPDIKLSPPTDSLGSTSVQLWENATGALPNYFRLTLPGSGEPIDFTVPAGVGTVPLVSRLDPPGSGTQSTRVVTMHQDHSDGTPWAGGVVTVTLESFCYTSLAIYPAGSIKITLDANGEASQPLIANGGATNASRIRWDLPNGDTFWVQIPAGNTPITLSALRALAEVPLPPSVPPTYQSPPTVPLSALEGLIAAHNSDTGAHPGGIASGGGGGGGSSAWASISGSQALAGNQKYLASGLSLQLLALPSNAQVSNGNTISIALDGTSFRVTQDVGQSIVVGGQSTTVGVTGSIGSTRQGDMLTIEYLGSGRWVCTQIQGNLLIT